MTLVYPQARTCPYHPSPAYEPLREGPMIRRLPLVNGQQAWIVSGHAEARTLLADPRVSSDRTNHGFPMLMPPGIAAVQTSPNRPFIVRDDPEHNRVRRMLISEFTVRRFKELKPDIDKIVHDTIDAMLDAGPPADLVTAFSLPIPSLVISRMLGVPYEDHDFFQSNARTMAQSQDPAEAGPAMGRLFGYLSTLAADPPPGLIARLKTEQVDTGAMKLEELIPTSLLLLVAGHETTASTLSLSAITLLEHPDQLAALHADPAKATEELLRYLSVVEAALLRVAIADIEIGEVLIKAGDAIAISGGIVNRDAAAFEDPDRFDLTRPAGHHLAFGYGVHQCLGQNLARMELQLALPALFDRIPSLRLAVPVSKLDLRPAMAIQGVNSLPVTW
jgi:pentalenic acid synthase